MGKYKADARRLIETCCSMYGIDPAIYQNAHFDLVDYIDSKVELESTRLQVEYFDYLEQHCMEHLKKVGDTLVYQETSLDVNQVDAAPSVTAISYHLLENKSLSKTKLQVSVSKETKDIASSYILSYQKEESIYLDFGLEARRVARTYEQRLSSKTQTQQILSCFPIDPDLWNMPYITEIVQTRNLEMDSARIEISIPSIHSVSFLFDYPLQLQTVSDLLSLKLTQPSIPEAVVSSLLKHQLITIERLAPQDEARKKHLLHLISQVTDVSLRQSLLDYYTKEPTIDSDRKLEIKPVYSLQL